MNTQDFLRHGGYYFDISLDTSELFDFTLDTTETVDLTLDASEFFDFTLDLRYDEMDHVDLVLDYSEYYDFELVNGFEINDNVFVDVRPLIKITADKYEWAVVTQEDFVLTTQDGEYIQYLN